MVRTALLSVFNKDDAFVAFARGLNNMGWNLLASSGTKAALDTHGIPSLDVATLVGEPILWHRVVTLDRRIYAALLADLTDETHVAELERIRVSPIHLVCVDLYPLADALSKDDRDYKSVVEKIDIGGPALLRAAAKGRRFAVSRRSQYIDVLTFLAKPPQEGTQEGAITRHRFLCKLAAEAERSVGMHVDLSAEFYTLAEEGRL